jgi:hypothetical protein
MQQNCLGGAGIFTGPKMAELLLQGVITGSSWHVEVVAAATPFTATYSSHTLLLTCQYYHKFGLPDLAGHTLRWQSARSKTVWEVPACSLPPQWRGPGAMQETFTTNLTLNQRYVAYFCYVKMAV